MPDRFLRDSICTSDNLNSLSPLAEIMFYRLIISCDDFGRYDARPPVLKGKLFPLKNYEHEKIQSWLLELQENDLIMLYESEGKPYLQIKTWEKYQRKRAKKSKFPDPPCDSVRACCQMPANVSACQQMTADDSNCGQSLTNAPEYECECEYRNTNANNDNSSSSSSDINTSLSPKGDTELRSKDTQNVTYTQTMDGMDRFTRKLEKPATAADYLMQIGINLDYFTAQEYEDFLSFGMDEETIMYAAHLAQSANAVSWAYVKTILTSWLDKGIKTKAQAEEEEKKRKAERKANAGKSQSSSKSPYKPDGTYDYEAGLSSEWESL